MSKLNIFRSAAISRDYFELRKDLLGYIKSGIMSDSLKLEMELVKNLSNISDESKIIELILNEGNYFSMTRLL